MAIARTATTKIQMTFFCIAAAWGWVEMGVSYPGVTTQAETRSSSYDHYKRGSFDETLIDHVTYKALYDL